MNVTLSDCVAIANLVVAVIAMYLGWLAVKIGRRTMQDAEEDWKHRKWYDLYFTASEAYSLVDRFRHVYPDGQFVMPDAQRDWNDMMMHIRQTHSMATAFPKYPIIDALFEATNFSNPEYAYDDARFAKLADAVEGLRQKALLNPSVLEQRTSVKLAIYVNAKRGFNRLVIVLSVAWAIYVLFVYPIQRQRRATDVYRVELHACSQGQLALGQPSDGCVQSMPN